MIDLHCRLLESDVLHTYWWLAILEFYILKIPDLKTWYKDKHPMFTPCLPQDKQITCLLEFFSKFFTVSSEHFDVYFWGCFPLSLFLKVFFWIKNDNYWHKTKLLSTINYSSLWSSAVEFGPKFAILSTPKFKTNNENSHNLTGKFSRIQINIQYLVSRLFQTFIFNSLNG